MTATSALSLWQRTCVALGNVAIRLSVGHRVPYLAEEIVRHLGFWGLMKLPTISRTIHVTMRHFGERDGQMLIGFAALWNGCMYCSRGHVLAAALYHLRDHQGIFPIAEKEVLKLRLLRDEETIEATMNHLCAPEFDRLRGLLRRQFEIRMGETDGETQDDQHLALTLRAWDWVTECSVMIDPDREIPPLAPIVHDARLLSEYRAHRNS